MSRVRMTLYIATTNPGKLRDFALAANAAVATSGGNAVEIRPLPGLANLPAPEETEDTFEGNATLKALFYSQRAPGLIVLADDSGLEVKALNGAPGVRSARYAQDRALSEPDGPTRSRLSPAEAATLSVDQRNNLTLLRDLEGIATDVWQARYRCSLVAACDGAVLASSDGTVDGEILANPRGSGGFGYDPFFFLPELGLTMAELDGATRFTLSHRGRALRALLPLLPHA